MSAMALYFILLTLLLYVFDSLQETGCSRLPDIYWNATNPIDTLTYSHFKWNKKAELDGGCHRIIELLSDELNWPKWKKKKSRWMDGWADVAPAAAATTLPNQTTLINQSSHAFVGGSHPSINYRLDRY
ncbi:hypothetical protein Fcan01_21225 [Folsomia candida]|uniref:Uncharacterized protein n=1 Tax=Folsomia candida TaxID=158441 RepID=A0A226DG93_FOLCA|nr:hypothetical protein Fcan01_21225 [Folsomia candida]